MPISLQRLVEECDRTLRTAQIKDYDGAVNGLQVENRGRVSRIAAAVDATQATVRLAIEQGADLLVVHHGLFWGASHPWTGKRYELIQTLIQNNLAVYSSHLPLDMHRKLGNNAQLAAALGLQQLKPFFIEKGQELGLQSAVKISRENLERKLATALNGNVRVIPGGPEICRRIGIVTGGAGSHLKLAADEGVDTFITGEGPHWTYALAEELGINVLYGGHYTTETFGVKALAKYLSAKFKVPWVFIDRPTGL
ncbi:MAG TPA: Nif3-like dinuclear metal center hexameric protein [Verrucomicrobiae bacterium]|nr:Nif3-like dinuclear metal center hexameric protein [Verrucomicrobiae bacterium]